MNTIVSFVIQVLLTLTLTSLIVVYIRPYLRKVLVDLCGTEDRAQFWMAFSNVVLIGLPMIISLNYRPQASTTEQLFFELAGRLSGSLTGFLIALVCVGAVVSFFALVAPRKTKDETK
jgi:type IV secretory pathway VirB6-like protein